MVITCSVFAIKINAQISTTDSIHVTNNGNVTGTTYSISVSK